MSVIVTRVEAMVNQRTNVMVTQLLPKRVLVISLVGGEVQQITRIPAGDLRLYRRIMPLSIVTTDPDSVHFKWYQCLVWMTDVRRFLTLIEHSIHMIVIVPRCRRIDTQPLIGDRTYRQPSGTLNQYFPSGFGRH